MLCCFMEKSRDIKRVKFCYVIAENFEGCGYDYFCLVLFNSGCLEEGCEVELILCLTCFLYFYSIFTTTSLLGLHNFFS